MSFTSNVKNEVSKLEIIMPECLSELSAILRNISTTSDSLKIMTENSSVARRIFEMLKQNYSIIPKITVRKGYNFHKSYIYILQVNHKIDILEADLMFQKNMPKSYLIEDEKEKRAYLQGLF